MISDSYKDELHEFCCSIALEAGRYAIENKDHLLVYAKDNNDVVTNIDLEIQSLLIKRIRKKYPEHNVIGEENTDYRNIENAKFHWIIDPIDGTMNFARGLSLYAVSIAITYENVVIIGATYDIESGQLFSASLNNGFYINNRKHTQSSAINLNDSIICTDWPEENNLATKTIELLLKLNKRINSVKIFGSATLALAWVASEQVDCYFNFSLDDWDIAAGALMVKEAGGKISKLNGQEWNPFSNSRSCIASNQLIHSDLLNYFVIS